MFPGRFNVVTDGSWGSCGKGLVTTALAHKHHPQIISTTNMANAGHTAVNEKGEAHVAKALPSAAILNRWGYGNLPRYAPHILVGSSAAFDLDQLMKEVQVCGVNYQLSVHPRAGVITEEHKLAEAGSGERSTKHVASTMQGCGTFLADKVLRKKELKLARDYPELSGFMTDHMPRKLDLPSGDQDSLMGLALPVMLHTLMSQYGYTILHEGSQGFSLDINHGSHYPECTSRGTTAVQNLADMGIGANYLGDVYLVIRPYPIRVGNVIENGKTVGYSGDCYPGQEEITWKKVADEAGMPDDIAESLLKKELTTVTKRLRRVFTFSDRQLQEAAIVNGATKIALNFANYIDWSVYGVNEYSKLTPKVKEFITRVEDLTKIPVTIIGTGPQLDHVVMI
jgi:adenylosuccinate synthase